MKRIRYVVQVSQEEKDKIQKIVRELGRTQREDLLQKYGITGKKWKRGRPIRKDVKQDDEDGENI